MKSSQTMNPVAPPGGQEEGFVTIDVVAFRLKKCKRTVEAWMHRGYVPFTKVGRALLFKWKDVEKQVGETFPKKDGPAPAETPPPGPEQKPGPKGKANNEHIRRIRKPRH